jgi:hypothetical protein
MLRIFLLICVLSSSFAKKCENFRVANDASLKPCFDQGLCNLATGCCYGNGYCQYNNATQVASCVCEAPQECRPGLTSIQNYIGPNCQAQNSSADCCTNGSDDLSFSNYGGCHLQNSTNLYPEVGARGSLLVRTGNTTYADGIGTSSTFNTTIDDMVNNLTSASRGNATTSNTMLGLGFLEFAIKDIVDYEYSNNTVTFYGVTYPTLKCQVNTNKTVATLKIPCQFANNASGAIDLGPLYDYSHRIPIPGGTGAQLGPYLDLTDAFVHWNTTHHMPYEFLVVLRYYAQYHYLAARNFEEYFCGKNSTVTAINVATCSIRNKTAANNVAYFPSDQSFRDWIYEQARRSTIRFSQALLQQSIINLGVEYFDPAFGRSGLQGKEDVTFQMFWNRDLPQVDYVGALEDWNIIASVPNKQEWNNSAIKTNFVHSLQAGLNPWISLRNPAYKTSTGDYLLNSPNDCSGYVASNFAKEVVRLSRTRCQRFGSQIAPEYKADIAIELHRAAQLGLDYKSQVASLTNSSLSGISSLNYFFGTVTETDPRRQLFGTSSSTAVASLVEISYVTSPNVDRTGYWHYNASYWADGNRFHPDPRFFNLPAFDYLNMWYCPGGYANCSLDISRNAAALVMGYDPRMDPDANEDPFSGLENPITSRSQGLTYNGPNLQYIGQKAYGVQDYWDNRVNPSWQLVADFLNPLFYQYDGLASLAVKQSSSVGDSINYYLPNPIVDSIPTNIGFMDPNYDGYCYQPQYFTGSTCRYDNSLGSDNGGYCYWSWYFNVNWS